MVPSPGLVEVGTTYVACLGQIQPARAHPSPGLQLL